MRIAVVAEIDRNMRALKRVKTIAANAKEHDE